LYIKLSDADVILLVILIPNETNYYYFTSIGLQTFSLCPFLQSVDSSVAFVKWA